MGYETALTISGKTLLLWRKSASHLPRFLYQFDQREVAKASEDSDDDSSTPDISVRFVATAAQVMKTLDAAGLGWDATNAAYLAVRQGSIGYMLGRKLGKLDVADVEKTIKNFQSIPPSVDLDALGTILALQWHDMSTDELYFFKHLTFDGTVEYSFGELLDVERYATEKLPEESIPPLIRAFESLTVLFHDAPLLAWPMLMCVFLRHLDQSAPVVLDLSEDAHDQGVTSLEEADSYLADYWQGSTEELSKSARALGQLFSALAAFETKVGKDYWFARASSGWGQLQALRNSQAALVTNKQRGDLFENFVEAVLRTEEPELEIVERNVRTREEEIDILVSNSLNDPFWLAMASPLILIECKNTTKRIGVPELRIFESKMRDRGAMCRIGIFASTGGFTSTFYSRLKSFQASDGVIFAVSGVDLECIVAGRMRITQWLRGPGLRRSLGREPAL